MIDKKLYEKNEKLKKIINRIKKDKEIQTIWKCQNITAIDRLQMSDHGPVHMKIVAENALKILKLLESAGVETSIEKNYGMSKKDAEIVVFIASVFHDLGMIIHREKHNETSLIIAWNLIDRLLKGLYTTEKRTIMKAEILHAIYSHTKDTKPLTLEASIVKLADGLDMEKGRARIPFKMGAINIHSVSALAIEKVYIEKCKEKPVLVRIKMKNPAGVFQITELLKRKIKNTPLEKYVKIVGEVVENNQEKILEKFEI